jgi:CelD/BcsL family acetyltransferase involved in cellulose biosynthesis
LIDEQHLPLAPAAMTPPTPLRLERVRLVDVDWTALDAAPDRQLFQTREWLEFLARTQRAEPVVARVLAGDTCVGHFTGMVVRRCGLRILGSPFPGWTTDYMGFNLAPGVDRRHAALALAKFAFGPLRCVHLELKDRLLPEGALDGLGFVSTRTMTFEADLTAAEPALFAAMSSACRRAIRKAEKSGVVIETCTDEAFAADYYHQLRDVFAKQALVPMYSEERVRELIRCLVPSGRLLLLRALAPDGRSIATGIFPAFGGTAYFWGGASLRSDQLLRPNELVFWHAMRYWRDRGITTLDFGGAGDYKRKYGGRELWVPWYRQSRFPGVLALRDAAKAVTDWRQRRAGSLLSGEKNAGACS